ncbi:MAG: hypothetical protein AB8B58_01460 [Roseobacter sp.]
MVPIPGAAFAAATQIDSLNAHAGFNPVKEHTGCAMVSVPAAFATARPDLTGRTRILAMS